MFANEYVQIVYTLNSEEEVRSAGMYRWEADRTLWELAVLDKQPVHGKRVAKALLVPVTVSDTAPPTFREGTWH